MATFNKFDSFVEAIAEKKHDLGADQLAIALTDTAPVAGNSVLTDITEAAYTYCSSRNLTISSSAQASGIYKLIIDDLILTASGGTVGPFRYVVIYNDTALNDELIGYFDYGSSETLQDGEKLDIDFSATNGLLTIQ